MDDSYKTPLIISAIEMAARNLSLPEDAIFHSERGSNYTSGTFAGALTKLGIRQSVGRTGICYDNALSESVNGSLKVELVHRTVYPTRKKAQEDIARWIELRYKRELTVNSLSGKRGAPHDRLRRLGGRPLDRGGDRGRDTAVLAAPVDGTRCDDRPCCLPIEVGAAGRWPSASARRLSGAWARGRRCC